MEKVIIFASILIAGLLVIVSLLNIPVSLGLVFSTVIMHFTGKNKQNYRYYREIIIIGILLIVLSSIITLQIDEFLSYLVYIGALSYPGVEAAGIGLVLAFFGVTCVFSGLPLVIYSILNPLKK